MNVKIQSYVAVTHNKLGSTKHSESSELGLGDIVFAKPCAVSSMAGLVACPDGCQDTFLKLQNVPPFDFLHKISPGIPDLWKIT